MKAASARWNGLIPYALLAVVTIVVAQLPPNNDVAWQLWIGRQLAAGGELYRDIIEINPPLWFWLAVPIVRAADLLGISGTAAVIGFLGLSAALSISLVQPLIERRALVPSLMVAAFFLVGLSATGQREQFTLIAVTPYVFLIAARADGKPVPLLLAIAVGAWAAMGLALKPHFALVPLALEAWLAGKSRFAVRPEFAVVVGLGALYLALVLLLTPEYLTAMIPLASEAYGEFNSVVTLLLSDAVAVSVLATGGLLLARPKSNAVQALAIAGAAFLVGYLLQLKGARYHGLPAIGLFSLAAAIALAGTVRPKAAALPLAMALVIAVATTNRQAARPYPAVMAATEGLEPGTRVLVLTPYGDVAWPAVELRRLQWTSRFMFLWMVPAILREPDKHEAMAQFVRTAIVEDMTKHRPELVLVERNLVPFLCPDRRFRAELEHFAPGPGYGTMLSWRLKQTPGGRRGDELEPRRSAWTCHAMLARRTSPVGT